MKIKPQTLAAVVVLTGLLLGGYLIGPAPARTVAFDTRHVTSPATPKAAGLAVREASARPPSTITARRPPVPLLLSAPTEYFVAAADATPAETVAPTASGDKVVDNKIATDSAAKAMIEQDGYRNVKALVKGVDGTWHGRAMRGSTEIAVSVDAGGDVSAN